MKKIYFVTSNEHKVAEAKKLVSMPLFQKKIELDEIQGLDVVDVSKKKALVAKQIIRGSFFVEDTALYIESLAGFPGPLSKWVQNSFGFKKLLKIVGKDRRALARCCITFYNGKDFHTFVGEVSGKIVNAVRGSNNFGWDPIFIPDGFHKIFAEMTLEEKNKISHRARVFRKFKNFLESQNKKS